MQKFMSHTVAALVAIVITATSFTAITTVPVEEPLVSAAPASVLA
ncbi:MAG: hypothetical protein WBA68_00050 [Alteraurantiacibacter sp.]